jgi:alpha-L-rhamnosidase
MKVAIAQVQVEHHESGFGISHASPRLSWRFASTTDRDWVQASYEIVVNRNGKEEQYKENSHDSVLVPWPSKPLTSRERATVKVRATGTDGSTTDWKETHLEVGLLERSEWKGDLISCPKRQVNEPKRPFRTWKDFRVDGEGKTARYA